MKLARFYRFFVAFYPLFVLPYQKVMAQTKAVYSKIIIEYGKGHNSWGDTGLYSRREVITIVPTNTGKYKITGHLNILSHASPARYWKDTIKLKIAKYKLINAAVIDSLLKQLSTTKQNFTYSFIRPKLTPPSQKQVVKLAKVLDVYYKLKDEDDDGTKEVVTKLRRFDKLDSFINAHKPTTDALVLVDALNYSTLKFIKKDTITYQNQFFNLLGQPFENATKPYRYQKGIINLEINTSIAAILPKSSLLKKVIELNSITEEYVKWYLDKML